MIFSRNLLHVLLFTSLITTLIFLVKVTGAEAPNVLLLSVDTLRADRLGAYGYKYDTTPHLDKLAEQGIVYTNAVCEVPLTGPSFGAMFASQFPRTTGTTRNGLRMPEDVPLVAEQFQQAGYQTICVQSNWTLKAELSGLDRGFDVYDDDFHRKRWLFIKSERRAPEVTEAAIRHFEGLDPEKPFFAWIHYTDPHAPYRFHRRFNPTGKRPFWLRNEEKVQVKYDSEVAFTDHHIARFLEVVPENTLILFISDHGESLYEHDYLGHGRRIHQTGMWIPFFIHGPGIVPMRNDQPVRALDVGPTLLGLAGLPIPASMIGYDLLSDEVDASRVRVVETYGGAVPNIPGFREIMSDAAPIYQGVLLEDWKLIVDRNGGNEELYHLKNDPMELENLDDIHPDRVEALHSLIRHWDEATEHGEVHTESLRPSDIRALRSLGYLE